MTHPADVLKQTIAEYLYSPPFANPEFLAIHSEKMELCSREHAEKSACELMKMIVCVNDREIAEKHALIEKITEAVTRTNDAMLIFLDRVHEGRTFLREVLAAYAQHKEQNQ